ncbi:MAG: hypothetical protein AAF647_13015, partial [Pseudomonadota bacterium]
LLVLSFVPLPAALSPMAAINAQNSAAIGEAIKENAGDIAALTEAIAILEVASSTDLGVSLVVRADVKIGAALSEAVSLMAQAQLVTLSAALILEFLRIATDLATTMSPYIYKATLLIALVGMGAAALMRGGAGHVIGLDIARLSLVVFLAFKLMIPLSIFASSWIVSQLDLHSLLDGSSAAQSLSEAAKSSGGDDDVFSHWGEGNSIKSSVNDLYQAFRTNVSDLTRYLSGLIVFHVMHGIVFPLLVFFILWQATRAALGHLFHPRIAALNATRAERVKRAHGAGSVKRKGDPEG